MRLSLELIRILAILLIIGGLLSSIVFTLYASFGFEIANTNGGMPVGIAILLILFVLYRNKLQFSGFYKGKGMTKLSKNASISLVSCAVLLLIAAPSFV